MSDGRVEVQVPANAKAVSDYRWMKVPVLDDGFICLVDVMGDDSSIAQAARVSYGAGTVKVNDDINLIRYLMRHRHTTPFEMVEMKFKIRVPMDCWRQWIRHRTASVNEYSTRYSEAIDAAQVTEPEEWRGQSKSNKQGSEGGVHWPDDPQFDPRGRYGVEFESPGQFLSQREQELQQQARNVYDQRLAFGVAREQARKDLPLSTYTEAYWKCDLHNIFHFLGLRMDSHAQLEIRQYANAMAEIVKACFPVAYQAFEDYRLGGMFLTRLDIEAIQQLVKFDTTGGLHPEWDGKKKCRERDECIAKLKRLNLIDSFTER